MKILIDLQESVLHTNTLITDAMSYYEENSDEFKILNHSLLTGNTMQIALKEALEVTLKQDLSAKKKINVMALIKATETWCNETKGALGN